MSNEELNLNLKIYLDGDQVCVLQGWNIQEGIAGFGPTVRDALYDFADHYTQECRSLKEHPWHNLQMENNTLCNSCGLPGSKCVCEDLEAMAKKEDSDAGDHAEEAQGQ